MVVRVRGSYSRGGRRVPSAVKGEWAGFRELHIEGDWLLIYRIDHGELCLVLTRTGSHDALFGRGGKNF